ncbi:MAG: hypothetical protein AB7D00_13450 [Rhodospirillaceae bacterium]
MSDLLSTLAGNASSAVSVLNNDGLSSLSWQQVVYSQIVENKQTELEKESAKVQEKYDAKGVYLEAQANQWAKVKASISNADLAVENGQEGVDQIKDILMQMRILVGNYAESESPDLLKEQYDAYVDQINNIADTYSKAYNPIGNVVSTDWTPNTITFQTNLAGNETSLTGTYVGSDYYITDSDGTVWVPDPGSSTITQYTVYNTENEPDSTKADGFASTRNGMQLDSYDAETGAITFTVNPDNEDLKETRTGTISFGGLGLMQSWFYDGLDTEEGRAAAVAAIDKADDLMTAAESRMVSMATSVKAADARADDEMSDLKDARSQAMRDELVDTYALQIKQQQELQVLQNTFSNMAQQQTYYEQIFAGVSKGPFYDITG